MAAAGLLLYKHKRRDCLDPPGVCFYGDDYSNSFGISGLAAFLARMREKMNPSNSRQPMAVRRKLIGYSSLPLVTDMPRRLFPFLLPSRA
jgi:hypothetical protein